MTKEGRMLIILWLTFEIVKFKKPTKDDLSKIHMFNPYGYIPILDDDGDSTGWNFICSGLMIRIYRIL